MKIKAEGPTITLGRATECTVPIKDRYLSRKHAEIAFASGEWVVRDCGSVNGTMLNGAKIVEPMPLRSGDRIVLGDSEVIFEPNDSSSISSTQLVAIDDVVAKNLAMPMGEVAADASARMGVLASLAMQFVEDRSMADLFEFILDRVVELLHPWRTAIALLGADGKSFVDVRLRRHDENDSEELYISRTLLGEVIEEQNVVSFVDTSQDERLARAESIIAQNIRSVVCAPLVVGNAVLGVLYLDYLAQHGTVSTEDVKLIAQVARFAAVKLETTRLREEAILKAKLDEELRTAYTVQSRLLPMQLPPVDGYVFAGMNKPCRTVSGDYYDVIARPDGRVYFIMADVSGKGVTAALVMSSVATAFNIFTRTDPSPAELVAELNRTLAPKTAPTKFVTMVVGRLDPKSGLVEFTNAGHVAPLIIQKDGVAQLTTTDMVVGLFAAATYRNQTVTLAPGDSMALFTDGVTEAENELEEQLGLEPIDRLLRGHHGMPAPEVLEQIERQVHAFAGSMPLMDDLTMMALTRLA